MSDEKLEELSEKQLLLRIARELTTIRQHTTTAIMTIRDAESEVPESMRRFITYMHDLHDVCYMYESRGQPVPPHVHREMERCDDRYRQLLEKHNAQGATFEKIRREMAEDKNNRWDHTKLLTKPGDSM